MRLPLRKGQQKRVRNHYDLEPFFKCLRKHGSGFRYQRPSPSEKRKEFGARERTRTSTTLRSLAPEASASASSATRARVRKAGSGWSQPHEAFLILPAGFFFVNATYRAI